MHDIEPRDGPADTELSGAAIASSRGRVKARGAARGTGEDRPSHESQQERGRRRRVRLKRESELPRSREKKESLTSGQAEEKRKSQEDKRSLWKREDDGPSGYVRARYVQAGLIEASKKARRAAITLREGRRSAFSRQVGMGSITNVHLRTRDKLHVQVSFRFVELISDKFDIQVSFC